MLMTRETDPSLPMYREDPRAGVWEVLEEALGRFGDAVERVMGVRDAEGSAQASEEPG